MLSVEIAIELEGIVDEAELENSIDESELDIEALPTYQGWLRGDE